MKKTLCALLMLALLLCCLPLALAADANMAFDETRVVMFENTTHQMVLNRSGDALLGEVTYTSSARCVSVDQNGLLTANGLGGSTITATVKVDRRTYTCTAYVTVNKPVTEIIVGEDNLNVKAWNDPSLAGLIALPQFDEMGNPAVKFDANGQPYLRCDAQGQPILYEAEAAEQQRLLELLDLPVIVVSMGRDLDFTVNCRPYDASDRKFKVETDNDAVARMLDSNTMRPVNAGECLVTAYSLSNPEVNKTYRLVVVKPVTGITIDSATKTVFVGQTLPLTAIVQPADATIPGVVWSSENPDVVSVDENGVVYGIKRGQATVRATATDGTKRYNRITLYVQQRPENVILSQQTLTLSVGTGRSLNAEIQPNNASDKSVVWTSSDDRIAKVNGNGYITPVSRGMCVITCASKAAPDVYAECYVEVMQPLTRIRFTEQSVSVNVGGAVGVYWTTEPANASDSSVTLSSSNTSIATVDQNGFVYGVKRGECYINAKANDGSGKTARITVNVKQPVYGVHMKNDTVTVGVHESANVTAVLEPSDASNNRMQWYSADSRIATVSGNNNNPRVTGQAWGTTTIYGTTEDGGYTTSCTVRVGNYDKALKITDLYLLNNAVKMVVRNDSDMNITYFTFTVELYDWLGQPIRCNPNGSNVINGSHGYTLYEGESTQHGRFSFGEFIQPETQIAKLIMRITSYRTDDGYRRTIAEGKQPTFVYESPIYVSPTPVPVITTVPTAVPQPTAVPTIAPQPTAVPYVTDVPVTHAPVTKAPDRGNGKHSYTAVLPVMLDVEADNKVRLTLQNFYQQSMQRVYFEIELYDENDNPIFCNTKYNDHIIRGYNGHQLSPNKQTQRGTFDFLNFQQPTTRVHYAIARVTGYLLMTEEKINIPLEDQPWFEYRSQEYTGMGHIPANTRYMPQ